MSGTRGENSGDRSPLSSVYLRLSLTPSCNLKCRYCRPASGTTDWREGAKLLTDAEFLDLVSFIHETVPVKKLRFTGGEPLMRPGLESLVEAFRRLLPEAELCLTTNGTLLEERAGPLARAGIRYLNISLDALDGKTFESVARSPGLERVLRGIDAAREAGFRKIKLNTVLMGTRNGDQLPGLVRTAADAGCEIRFVELMPFGEGARIFEEEFLSAGHAFDRISERFTCLGPEASTSTARRYRFDVEGREAVVGFITAMSHPFCDTCNRVRLDCLGRMYSCLRSEEGLDLAAEFRAGRYEALRSMILEAATAQGNPCRSWPSRFMVQMGG